MTHRTSRSTHDLGNRDSGIRRVPRRSGPYFLYQGKFKTYDYSDAASTLGHDFVAAACEIVRQQKYEAGVTQRTWIENYVYRLGELLNALQIFLIADNASPKKPSQFSTRDWSLFGTWLENHLQSLPLSALSRTKALNTTSKLLLILHRTGVIPAPLKLKAHKRRDRALVNHSRFTERGWNHNSTPPLIDTPFKFSVEAHGREYDYTGFRDLGRQFIMDATSVLRTTYHTFRATKAKDSHEVWTSVLRYITSQRNNPPYKQFIQTLNSSAYRSIGADVWEGLLYNWRETFVAQVESGQLKRITPHHSISKLNLMWASFADAGLVPHIRVRGFKNAKSSYFRQSRATLAQLPLRDPISDAALRAATERLSSLFDDSDRDEVRQYLRSLSERLTPKVVAGLPIESIAEEILTLNTERLLALRRCAERDFRKWHEHWLKGQAALRDCKLTGPQLIDLVEGPQWSVSEIRGHSKQLFFDAPDSTRLGNVLQYIDARYGGAISAINGRIHHIARSFGGRAELTAYLNPHAHATISLWVLLLVDTGANCEVARTTPWECLLPPKESGWRPLILGAKYRAGGAHIRDEFPENNPDGSLSLVQAISTYKLMASRYHAMATPSAKGNLFVHEFKGSIDLLKEWTARAWFISFLTRHPDIAQFDVRPSMIRPSVLMCVQHRNDNHIEYAQAIGDHKSPSTTAHSYTGHIPIKIAYALKIRAFQNLFQTVLIVSINGAAAKLGLTERQFTDLFSDAKRTGLGVACLDAYAGVQPGTHKGQQCTRFEQCCTCRMRWIVATVENVADLILFKDHLERSLNASESTERALLAEKWLPWLIFAEIALQKLRESECIDVYENAMKLATQRRAGYPAIPLS